MTQKKKILTRLLLVLTFVIILGLILTPVWWKSASQSDFLLWYPYFGNALYLIVHYLVYVLIAVNILIVVFVNFDKIRRLDINARSFYIFSFIILITQFVYCKFYPEFYPAVMMPLFDGGQYSSTVKNTRAEIIVVDLNQKEYRVNTKDLLDDFVGSRPHKDKVSLTFLNPKEADKSYRDWLKLKLTKLLNVKNIKSIDIIKIDQTYSFHKKMHLEKEVRTKTQTILF